MRQREGLDRARPERSAPREEAVGVGHFAAAEADDVVADGDAAIL
jgi:hypothetical protein